MHNTNLIHYKLRVHKKMQWKSRGKHIHESIPNREEMQSTQKYNQQHLYLAIKTKLNGKNTTQNTQQACILLPYPWTTTRISKSGKVNTKCHKQQRETTRKNSKGEKRTLNLSKPSKQNNKNQKKNIGHMHNIFPCHLAGTDTWLCPQHNTLTTFPSLWPAEPTTVFSFDTRKRPPRGV